MSEVREGRWRIVGPSPRRSARRQKFIWVKCTCGVTREVRENDIKIGHTKSCGCLRKEVSVLRGKSSALRPYEALYNKFVSKAEHTVQLSYEQFLNFIKIKDCHYCGAPIFWAKENCSKNGSAYNLDRKDNSLGYTEENCAVCCHVCNRSKSANFTYEEWACMTAALKELRNGNTRTSSKLAATA